MIYHLKMVHDDSHDAHVLRKRSQLQWPPMAVGNMAIRSTKHLDSLMLLKLLKRME